MIGKLRRRMTCLVAAVLVLVTVGIIFSINYMNWRNITSQAENALETLAANSGTRPAGKEPGEPDRSGDPDAPEDPGASRSTGSGKNPAESGEHKPQRGQPPEISDALATLSNYYVVTLDDDGGVKSWTSDRSYLYSDEQVSDMTQLVLESGQESGRIGTQFYTLTRQSGSDLLIVLDERLEIMAARKVLQVSALIAAIACFLLCVGAYFLIRFMVRPVQDAFDRQRQFVWDASHELKTPLAVIGANAQVLRGEIGPNESLQYITDEVDRTDRMLRNLLTLARTDQGTVTAEMADMDLSKAVLSCVLPFESSAFDEGKTIDCEIPAGIHCRGDADMLRQLTVILLSNALKYSDPGSVIKVSITARGKGAELRVSNLGDGIAPRDMDHIFDRFYRADASHSREVEGHGLGLAIASNIVEMHKGRMTVTSEPDGNGRCETAFTVTLPLR